MEGPDGYCLPLQQRHFLRLFSTRDQQATLVPAFSYALQQPAIPFVSLTVVTGLTPPLQNGLDIVQHQQAATRAEVFDQEGDLAVQLCWQNCTLLVRDELDALLQDTLQGRRIMERAPKDEVIMLLHLIDHGGSQARFAHTSHTQDRHQATVVLHQPPVELGQFLLAPVKLFSVGSLAPIDVPTA